MTLSFYLIGLPPFYFMDGICICAYVCKEVLDEWVHPEKHSSSFCVWFMAIGELKDSSHGIFFIPLSQVLASIDLCILSDHRVIRHDI